MDAKTWMAAAGAVVLAAALAGCGPPTDGPEEPYLPPVPVQQQQAYPETVTGRFVSLVDFEPAELTGRTGRDQLADFEVASPGGRAEFVVHRTRTGSGALEAELPVGGRLIYHLREVHDFSEYTLLSLAVRSPAIRDDLRILIRTDRADWVSHPVLLRPGWNTVLVDIRRLRRLANFETRGVREIHLSFAAPDGPVVFGLDDVLLIDNTRPLGPTPDGVELRKHGLDYSLKLPGRDEPVDILQGEDGLWRFGRRQATVHVAEAGANGPAGAADAPVAEDLLAMGRRRVGEVVVAELNPVRVRLVNTWYFPTSAGQWETLAIRQIRWEHTFYADGRQVVDLTFNNAGGPRLSSVIVSAPDEVIWADGLRARTRRFDRLIGSVGRWSYAAGPGGPGRRAVEEAYARPGRLEVHLGAVANRDGDAEGDGFDETRGCYVVRAAGGQARLAIHPPPDGLADAPVRVWGRWEGPITAGCEGRRLRPVARLEDGSVVFVVPGPLKEPTWIEAAGRPGGGAAMLRGASPSNQ
jgi:hypothetical protein